MNETCKFCLEFDASYIKMNDVNVTHITKTIFPTKNMDSYKDAVICVACHSSLKSVYDFTTNAKESNRKLCAAVIKNDKLCQTCTTPVENSGIGIYLFNHFENTIPYYEIKEMLNYSSLDLDFENYQCPVICSICFEKLQNSFHFLKKCAENEQLIFFEENSFMEENFVQIDDIKQVDYRIPEIKIEFDEETIKTEPLDVIEDNLLGTLTEYDEYYSSLTNNFVYCKEEILEEASERKLFVKLERLDSPDVIHEVDTKSEKAKPALKCDLCPFTTQKKYRYNLHITTHMTLEECAKNNALFKCDNCAYRTKRKYSLIRHFKEVHRLAYVCEKCGYETNSALSFKLHVQTEHNNNIVSYTCKECPYIAFTKVKLNQHVKTHDLHNVLLKCSQCEFETKEVARLNEHKMCHKHMKVGKLYKCEICSYQVKKKSTIDRHVLTHFTKKQLSDKLYKCHQCHYKAKRKDSLAIHIRNLHAVRHGTRK